jgi:hypothetical protein
MKRSTNFNGGARGSNRDRRNAGKNIVDWLGVDQQEQRAIVARMAESLLKSDTKRAAPGADDRSRG